ncbi:MAG: protein kinase [Byssovorax sp.]
MIGQILDDRYAILRLVGQGGMGAVYEARHTGTNRRVAVKVILDAGMDGEQVARFQREASIVGAIESQHITLVYDTGRDRQTGAPYIAMELLDGEDAEKLLERLGPLPVDLAVRIVYQACLGLGRAHKAGVVHRDIKTANLFLHRTESGQRIVKILDFGIAKPTGGDAQQLSLTRTGALLGSPLYMSPEQAMGGAIDPRSDVWSMGLTLYEMLCGVRPNEDVPQLGALIVSICTQPVRRLETLAPRVPRELADLVHCALTINPAKRFPSAIEMGEALRAFLPQGYAIEEWMLRPLDAAERASAHPAAAHAASGNIASGAFAAPPVALAVSGAPLARSGTVPGFTLGTGGAASPSAPPRAPSRAPIIAGAIAVTAVIGVGAGVLLTRGQGTSATPAPIAPVTAAPIESAAAPPPIESTAPGASAPVISPASAVASAIVAPVVAGVQAPKTPVTAAPKPAVTAKPVVKKGASDDESSRK